MKIDEERPMKIWYYGAAVIVILLIIIFNLVRKEMQDACTFEPMEYEQEFTNINPEDYEVYTKGTYVHIFGHDKCGLTAKMVQDLKRSNVKFTYKDLDEIESVKELYLRLKDSGHFTAMVYLPVVQVNEKVFIRPNLDTILALYFLD